MMDVTDVNDKDDYDPTSDEEEIEQDAYHGIDRVIDVTYDSDDSDDDDDDSFPTMEEGNKKDDYEVMDDLLFQLVKDDDDDYRPTTTEEDQREADPNEMEAMNVDDHDINCKREPTTEDVNQERTQEEGRRDDSIPEVRGMMVVQVLVNVRAQEISTDMVWRSSNPNSFSSPIILIL